jgi:phosphonopyruvate decarboxylase
MGYEMIYEASTKSEIKNSIIEMESNNKLSFLEIKVGSGFRKNLGRPTRTPLENKKDFMEFLDK